MTYPLALDHITVTDTTPAQLAEAAAATGCRAICLFLEPMAVLPQMPQFDIYRDLAARRELIRVMSGLGVGLDIAYPFTLAGRTEVENFELALECAADLGTRYVNALVYDRDPERRIDKFGAFCDLADRHGLGVAVEFYPVSQVRSLDEGLSLVRTINRPGKVGLNVDLLHLMRSGGSIEALAAAPPEYILYGQLCDGPATYDETQLDFEASSQRLLPGEGVFDLAGFAKALPPSCPVSVELPQSAAIKAGMPMLDRARQAVVGVREALAGL